LDLAGRTNFETHSSLSMPDLSNCAGNCNENSSAGFDTASTELNLVMRTPGEQIEALQSGFLDEQKEIPEEATFFASREIDEDLSALDELGIDTSALDTGALVSLTSEMFDRARMLPAGLIYKISCGSDGTEELQIGHQNKASVIADAIGSIRNTTSSGASEGEDADWWDVNEGNEPPPEDDEGGPEATNLPTFRNVVIVTDCRLHLTEFADIQGSLVLATHIQTGLVLTANPGASAGDQNLDCAADRQSIFMVRGNALIPPSLTASNASFIIDGEALVTGDLSGGIAMHLGMSLHASGRVKFDGKHSFEACSGNLDMALPELKVIKYVLPTDPLR
jgi:hypothetical protein